MRAALARVLIILASIVPWFGNIYMFIMPVTAVAFGKDSDSPLLIYTYIFFGMWAAYWVLDCMMWGLVAGLQFIFFGTTARAELILESRLDRPEVQELLNNGKYTRQSLGELLAVEMKENLRTLRPFMYFIMGSIYVVGFIVVYFMGKK